MTADRAIELTKGTLSVFGVTDFLVVVCPFTEHPQRFGVTKCSRRTIFLNDAYLDDDAEMRETIIHECTHVFRPGVPCFPFEDKVKVADFAAAFKIVERAFQRQQ